jgi:dienelactone hydrolase
MLLIVFASSLANAAGDDSVDTRVFTASEIPRLSRGIELPRKQFYVKVWAPARQVWSMTLVNNPDDPKLTFVSKTEGDEIRPAWQSFGWFMFTNEKPIKIMIEADKPADSSKSEDKEKAKAAKTPLAVPAMLVLTTDPKFDPAHALDLIRGRLDSVDPPADPRRTTVRTNQQGASFKAPATAQAWHDRTKSVREQLLVTLGLWPMPPKTPLNPRIVGKLERDGYTIERVALETLPGFILAGNLYRPIGKTGKVPAILCPHGHWSDGRVNPEVQQRCIRWAKLGCVVFLYDMVGYNDSKTFGHEFLNPRLDRWGISLPTLQTWNSLRAVDWIASLPDVDPARIGCTGESGGGTQTFLLTALEPRIAVAAPVVMVSDGFQGGCVCENAAGLRLGTDNVEFAALTAPRPLKLVGATGDWTAKTMTNAYPSIGDVYQLVGVPDRISADVYNFPHNYNQTTRNAVYAFMGRWLLGIEDADSTKEGKQETEKPEDLRTFNDQNPPPAGLKTPEQLENELIDVLGRQIEKLAPGSDSVAWAAARQLLMTSLRVRVGLTNPPPAALASREIRKSSHKGLTIIHSVVGREATKEEIPVVRLIPSHPSDRLTVIMNPHGKAKLADGSGQPAPLVQALLERGQSVVGFDALLVGESLDPSAPATRRKDVVHYETYNPVLAADRLQDLATVLAWARSQPDVREVSLVGQGRSGPLVLLARPLLEGIARTAIDMHEFDYGDGAGSIPEDLDLPGVLQFGALPAAAALSAPAPLWLVRPGPKFAADWPTKAYSLSDNSSMLRIDAKRPTDSDLARWIDSGE